MKFEVGERLEGGGPSHQPGGYVIASVVRETPWHALYAAKKIFYNFDFTAKRVRETDEKEWLDVYLRTLRYPLLDQAQYVAQRRALARAEARLVLGSRQNSLWPEPVDLLEIENTRDRFAFPVDKARDTEPILVFARPQGSFTADWQQTILPLNSILAVLAEMLEFVRQAHDQGLLLLGLCPAALLIDASDRVHYLGGDLSISQQSMLLKESTPAEMWTRLCPAERFPRGYAAPECYTPSLRPDLRSDLYAWGALAYNLLTVQGCDEIAQEQGTPWAQFQDGHFDRVRRMLHEIPPASVEAWAEQLGVPAAALRRDWPGPFVQLMRLVLSPERSRRPRSVAELRAWLVDPPPTPITSLVALIADAGTAQVLIDGAPLDSGLELIVQRRVGAAAEHPADGQTVYAGPLVPSLRDQNVPLTLDTVWYTAFTCRRDSDRLVFSPGVAEPLWQTSPLAVRQWVEQQAALLPDTADIPARVALALGQLDASMAADSLLASSLPRVRHWGLRSLEQYLQAGGAFQQIDHLLWRVVRDPSADLREAAALLLAKHLDLFHDETALRLLGSLEAAPIDRPVPLASFLRRAGVPEARGSALLLRLDEHRPAQCPLCPEMVSFGMRADHLRTTHGYLPYEGDMLPADVVRARLWERVFHRLDRAAHDQLVQLHCSGAKLGEGKPAGLDRYVADLDAELASQTKSNELRGLPMAIPFASFSTYLSFLQQSPQFLPIVRLLLRSQSTRLREVGREAVVPWLAEQMRGSSSASDLARVLDQVCPALDQVEEKVVLCNRLPALGVDASAAATCVVQIQEEKLVPCPECKAEVRRMDLEFHLRRAHRVFEFRGERREYAETRQAILKAVCASPPDVLALRSLISLVEDKHADEPLRNLVNWLFQHVKEVDVEQRPGVLVALAEAMIAADSVRSILPVLMGRSKNATWELLGQRLALEIAVRVPASTALETMPLFEPLLDLKELPRKVRENATMNLLRAAGKQGAAAARLLQAFGGRASKTRAIERIQSLEQRFGHAPAIDQVLAELDLEVRMNCPRCAEQMAKKDMIGHLWQQHRLVLDGQRARDPWRILEDWVVDYGLEKDADLLQRCRELALQDDPAQGLARLNQLMFKHGVRERALLAELQAEAHAQHASLCPHCFQNIPMGPRKPPEQLTSTSRRLTGFGYRIEVYDSFFLPRLDIETPTEYAHRGHEPGRGLSRGGMLLLLFGPILVVSFFLVRMLTRGEFPAFVAWALALGMSLAASGFLFLAWPRQPSNRRRLLRAAWEFLIPDLVEKSMGPSEWGFLRELLDLSDGYPIDGGLLVECHDRAAGLAKSDAAALACLNALTRRYFAELADAHDDMVAAVLEQASSCFEGKTPLAYAAALLGDLNPDRDNALSKPERARLRILLAHQAFLMGLDLDDWLNLGRVHPEIVETLGLDSRWHWVQFHALWTQHNQRPWDSAGQATPIFLLARSDPAYADITLQIAADALLVVKNSPITVGSKGVSVFGSCIAGYASGQDVRCQKVTGGYEILVGALRVRCLQNPRDHLVDLQRWLRWYFEDFLPRVPHGGAPDKVSPHKLWQASKVACPHCGRASVPILGDIGLRVR